VAGYSPTDPIEPVNGVSSLAQGQQSINALQGDAKVEKARWQEALENKQAAHVYSCYMLVIQMINHLSLDKMDTQIVAESQMMNIEQQIQSKMIDISKFISQLQGESTSYTPYSVGGKWSPDSFLGLKEDFYRIGEGPANWGQEQVSSDYQTSMDKFVDAFKTLFYCNTDNTAPTVGSLSQISNPNVFQGGEDFNLTGLWANLENQYSVYSRSYSSDMSGNPYATPQVFKVVSSNPSDHASLIQQYMFYKAQITVDGDSAQLVNNAHGDITKLLDLGTDDSGDAFLQQIMQIISTFNSSESVSRTTALTPLINTQSANVLDLILQDQRNNYIAPTSSAEGNGSNNNGVPDVGLYGAFSYMAFNSFWTHATTSTNEETISAPPFLPHSKVSAPGLGGGDALAGAYSGANNVITSLGTLTGDESSMMQELTSNEGETVNIGQSALQALKNAINTFDMNQLDG